MDRYVAFLRGMNLGNRRITNEELREHFEGMGFGEVATLRASGNVIFGVDSGEAEAKLQGRVEKELDERLGYDVAVFLRSVEELAAIADREPFDASLVSASKGKLQVHFLAAKPAAKARTEALVLATDEDRLAIEGRELYWLPGGGISESDLDLKALDRTLGKGTMRTMGTVAQIAAKHRP
jgi:uncharacterized protein (DUF1697 family)